MALKIQLDNTSYGIKSSEAYAKITILSAYKEHATFQVAIYANQEARETFKVPLETRHYSINTQEIDGPIWIYLYNNLKSLPEYENAIDV